MGNILSSNQALALWHDVTHALVLEEGGDLSARQMTIMLTVYLEPPPHTVRGLATKLGVTKPAITRALDSLGHINLLTRRRDATDKRNVLVLRTVKGARYVDQLATTIKTRAAQLSD